MMTQAILTVLSSGGGGAGGAFRPYSGGSSERKKRRGGGNQSMIKTMHGILRKMEEMKVEESGKTVAVNHMLSERKRREKLNESFEALRAQLPQGTKKDKASVLAAANDYLRRLEAQIKRQEAKNRALELRLSPEKDEAPADEGRIGRIRVVGSSSRTTAHTKVVELKVSLEEGCELGDAVLAILQCIKEEGGGVAVESMAARSESQARLTLQVPEEGWDEEAFGEAIRTAIVEASRSAAAAAAAAAAICPLG